MLFPMTREYKEVPAAKIPKLWEKSHTVGREPGTRWYVEKGYFNTLRTWLKDIEEANLE